ncbi:MAG TPA: zinc-binding dehydrogenase, partial [Actinomycetota bacterium]|nr:zinc-binding dehydrogenase [Actinomycetota bacterium]
TNMRNMLGVSLRGGKDVTQVSAHVGATELDELSALIAAGHVHPVIDRTYGFDEMPAAIAYVEHGHARGKVVVTVP